MAGFTGYTAVKRKHRGTLGISIAKEYRGQGLGLILMNFLLEKVKTLPGILSVELNVMAQNEPALKLYKKLGFKEVSFVPKAFLVSEGTGVTVGFFTLGAGSVVTYEVLSRAIYRTALATKNARLSTRLKTMARFSEERAVVYKNGTMSKKKRRFGWVWELNMEKW